MRSDTGIQVRRLPPGDVALARTLFAMMARVFGEEASELSDGYLRRLLARDDFWVLAALDGQTPCGGLTAHALPMTRAEESELFLYDLAVEPSHQRRGVGRALITTLRSLAADTGITEVFVPADNDDTHALDFYRAVGGSASPVTFFSFSGRE